MNLVYRKREYKLEYSKKGLSILLSKELSVYALLIMNYR